MNYNLLKGKRGIIFGALNEQSIAWKVAEKAVENGAIITLSNTPVAVRMGETNALAEKLNCEVIAADATSVADLENVFKRSMEVLGGQIDFVLHSIGMSPNVRKRRTYDDLDYDMLGKTLDISAVSFHKMIQAAKKLNAIADYGSIIALSYVAAQRTFFGYNDMADAKALLESIARSFGYIYGREHHVRVNTISQSPTMTTAGSGVKGMDKLFDFANRMSPLGNASAEECADYCIVMFSDLTRKVTMQNLYHDGGFSSMGMSLRAMTAYERAWKSIWTKTEISFTDKHPMMETALYLIPVTLGDTSIEQVLPSHNKEIILGIKHFIVEDVRSARRFLKKVERSINIDELTFYPLNKHTSPEDISGYLKPLQAGQSMGVISEAGCPAVADPGADVVAIAQRKNLKVVPLVGPSSIILSVMGSGFNGQSFAFHGYLPIEPGERAKRIKVLEQRIYAEDQTQLFIETPYRNNKMMEDILKNCRPQTKLCIAANITCEGEYIKTKTVKEWQGKLPDLSKIPCIFLIYK